MEKILKHDNKIIDFTAPEKTNYELIYESNKNNLDDICINYMNLNKVTYKDFFKNVEKVSKSLIASGLKEGDTVTFMGGGTLEAIYLLYALSYTGIRGNFVNFMFPKEDVDDQIRKSESKMLFLFQDFYDAFYNNLSDEAKENTVIIKSTDSLTGIAKNIKGASNFINEKLKNKNNISNNNDLITWEDFLKKSENINNIEPVKYDKERVSYIYNTSRSSGVTKAVELTEDALNKVALEHEAAEFLFNRGETVLTGLPPFLGIFSSVLVHMPLYLGVRLDVDPTINTTNAIDKVMKYNSTYVVLPTTWYKSFLTSKKGEKADFSNTKLFVSAGFTPSLKDEIEISDFIKKQGCDYGLAAGYSFTEGGSAGVLTPYTGKVLGSAGTILPYTNLKVFDENLKELKRNNEGELFFHYDGLMKGYFRNKEETKKAFVLDEHNRSWYRSNDIGLIDEDGNVFVHGRKGSSKYINKENKKDYLFNLDRKLEGKEFSICRTNTHIMDNNKPIYISHIAISKDQENDIDNTLDLLNERLKEISSNEHYYRLFDEKEIPYGMTGKPLPEKMFINTDNLIKAFEKNPRYRIINNEIVEYKNDGISKVLKK